MNNNKSVTKILDEVLFHYLETSLEGTGTNACLNMLKASIAKDIIIHIKAEIAKQG